MWFCCGVAVVLLSVPSLEFQPSQILGDRAGPHTTPRPLFDDFLGPFGVVPRICSRLVTDDSVAARRITPRFDSMKPASASFRDSKNSGNRASFFSVFPIPAPGGVAPAGDTVEIVRVVDGRGHGHVAGVRIRASARFCAAHADNIPTRLSAARLFDGSG